MNWTYIFAYLGVTGIAWTIFYAVVYIVSHGWLPWVTPNDATILGLISVLTYVLTALAYCMDHHVRDLRSRYR